MYIFHCAALEINPYCWDNNLHKDYALDVFDFEYLVLLKVFWL